MKTKAKPQAEPTPGPWRAVVYTVDDKTVEKMRQLDMEPLRALTNDGEVSVMADGQLVAHVACQADYKRGQGHTAECAERDANARLIALAPTMYAYVKARAEAGDEEAARILDGLKGAK